MWSKIKINFTANYASFLVLYSHLSVVPIFPLTLIRTRILVWSHNILETEGIVNVGGNVEGTGPVMILQLINKYLVILKFKALLYLPISYFTQISANVQGMSKLNLFVDAEVDFYLREKAIHLSLSYHIEIFVISKFIIAQDL